MEMIDIHKSALQDIDAIVLHEFKLRYKKKSHTIYGFVEGKDDPCFYRGFIENAVPEKWKVELWPAGNKESVYKIYSNFDWKQFDKNQILFFVDKDLSMILERKYETSRNIYVTDEYSIENSIVTPNTCDRVLREICGFTFLKYAEMEIILDKFQSQLHLFKKELIPVMSCILYWHKNKLLNKQSRLNNILMKHLFQVSKGVFSAIVNPDNKSDIIAYVHEQCSIDLTNRDIILEEIKYFTDNRYYEKYTRGKYLLWFLVEFCLSIHQNCTSFDFISIPQNPKMTVNLSQSSGVVLIAPRCRIPDSLRLFFETTISKYVATIKITG